MKKYYSNRLEKFYNIYKNENNRQNYTNALMWVRIYYTNGKINLDDLISYKIKVENLNKSWLD